MKVICINDNWDRKANEPAPAFLQECTVTNTKHAFGRPYYKLAEFPVNLSYLCEMFATRPTESDEQAIEAQQEAIIYQR